jgi:hypothetical protein
MPAYTNFIGRKTVRKYINEREKALQEKNPIF